MAQPTSEQQLSRELVLRLLLIIILALALRLAVYAGRAQNDPEFDFSNPSLVGNDQRTFIRYAESLLEGTWPNKPFYHQPGNSYWIATWLFLTGDLHAVQIINIIIASFCTLVLFDAARLLSNSTRAGLIAALLFAIYPVAAFYDSTLLDAPLTVNLAVVVLALAARIKHTPRIWLIVLTGLLIGYATFVRGTMVTLLPALWLAVWLSKGKFFEYFWYKTGLSALAWLTTVVVITPAIWWNSSLSGEFTLTTTSGPYTTYLGNNRDSMGTNYETQALQGQHLLGGDYMEAMWSDIQAEPGRAAGLFARKLGLMFGNLEISNNFNYYKNGLASTPLLHISPLNFTLIALPGLAGIVLAAHRREWEIGIPLLYMLGATAITVFVWVNSRVRIVIVPPLILLAAHTFALMLHKRVSLRDVLLSFGVSGAILLILAMFAAYLPRPRFLSPTDLPEGFTPLDGQYVDANSGDVINVLGFLVDQDEVYPRTGLFITLLWHVEETPTQSYSVFVHLWNEQGDQIGVGDLEIGGVSHPVRLINTWPDGAVFQEQVMVRVPQGTLVPATGTLTMGVYATDSGEPLLVSGAEDSSAALPARVRVVERYPYSPQDPQVTVNARFNDVLILRGYSLQPENLQPGNDLVVKLVWAVDDPLPVDAVLFLHLLDADGNLMSQADTPPLAGSLPTALWRAGDQWEDVHSLPIPADLSPGSYRLNMGLYSWPDGVRVSVSDAGLIQEADNILTLAVLQVE